MAKLHHSGNAQETELKQAALIQQMSRSRTDRSDPQHSYFHRGRTRAGFRRSDPAYPVLAKTLMARRDNLLVTIADLRQRLSAVSATAAQVATAA